MSQQAPMRLAAIDVGTNSIRLIVAEVAPDGSYRVIDDEKEVARLGRGLAHTGELRLRAMRESALTIARMKDIADGYGVRRLRIVGTSAVRQAANRDHFLAMVRQQTGLAMEVISAEEEARLAHLSAARAFDLRAVPAAVVDIGGGSTEVVLSAGGVVEKIATLALGAVGLTEAFDVDDGDQAKTFERLRKHIRRTIKAGLGRPPFAPQLLIGTGGTFTALAAVSMHAGSHGSDDLLPFTVRGYEMQRSEVKHMLQRLAGMPLRARMRVPGLSPDRAEIIVAGAAIVEGMMKHLGVNSLRVHDRGIRDGLLLTMIGELLPRAVESGFGAPGGTLPGALDRLRSVRQFAAACRFEESHSLHVTRLALELFDQLAAQRPDAPGGWSDPVNRELLEAAAILHDVGYYINYDRHHKHGYHLIIHSELAGFTHRELEVIANVARYHRLAEPRKRHPAYAALRKADRRLVKRLAAILRLADGLDRAHAQEVRAVRLKVRRGAAVLQLESDERPDVGIWGAQRKGGLFKEVFDLPVEFEWTAPAAAATDRSMRGVSHSAAADSHG
jgi:exopolyphosphatase/guanosine-5'-triphosphate,3'-diphosphate pyrophosphatase